MTIQNAVSLRYVKFQYQHCVPHMYVTWTQTSALPPINKRKNVLVTKLHSFLSSIIFYSHCFNHFIICLPFSFSLQAGSLVLEQSLGCQATSFSLFRFWGKNVAHLFTLSPWHKFEPTLQSYQTLLCQAPVLKEYQPSSLASSQAQRKVFSTILFIYCEWIWTWYWIDLLFQPKTV